MKAGLYSLDLQISGRSQPGGVIVFRDGTMLGGDAHQFYVGSYMVSGSTLRGQVVVSQHAAGYGALPLNGAGELGIGFSGDFDEDGASIEGKAGNGGAGLPFRGKLKRLAEGD